MQHYSWPLCLPVEQLKYSSALRCWSKQQNTEDEKIWPQVSCWNFASLSNPEGLVVGLWFAGPPEESLLLWRVAGDWYSTHGGAQSWYRSGGALVVPVLGRLEADNKVNFISEGAWGLGERPEKNHPFPFWGYWLVMFL